MWLHESESYSLIRQACKNKIFLTIIYISYNSLTLMQTTHMLELETWPLALFKHICHVERIKEDIIVILMTSHIMPQSTL